MKRRTKIIIVTALMAIGLTALHFCYGLFTPYNYITAKWDIAQGQPRMLQYGELDVSDQQAVKLAPVFGFRYEIVAGCAVTSPLVTGIEAYNGVTTKYLDGKLGKDWEKKFQAAVDSLFRVERVELIRKTVLEIDDVKQMNGYLDSVSGGKRQLLIKVLPLENNGPNVSVGEIMSDSSIRIFYYYQVDPYSLEVSRIQY